MRCQRFGLPRLEGVLQVRIAGFFKSLDLEEERTAALQGGDDVLGGLTRVEERGDGLPDLQPFGHSFWYE